MRWRKIPRKKTHEYNHQFSSVTIKYRIKLPSNFPEVLFRILMRSISLRKCNVYRNSAQVTNRAARFAGPPHVAAAVLGCCTQTTRQGTGAVHGWTGHKHWQGAGAVHDWTGHKHCGVTGQWMIELVTRMHSSRMGTDRGSNHLGGMGESASYPFRPDTLLIPDLRPDTHPPSHQTPSHPPLDQKPTIHPRLDTPSPNHRPDIPTLWTEWMTNACENSTFSHTLYEVGNKQGKVCLCSCYIRSAKTSKTTSRTIFI